ncbi:MAG: hypothetical protein DMF56_19365 [Acidobacteria bacterium]|nr:MAG: hypothetical protein DMF56_19365 [Acidobacteriota bacterium]
MSLSRDSILALQRHFLGALSEPARTWLEPMAAARVAFAGDAIRIDGEGCLVDFGTVESPGEDHRLLRVSERGARISEQPPWLTVRWIDDSTLALIAIHDTERDFCDPLRLSFSDGRSQALRVRMSARRTHPIAELNFNGWPAPHPFDFGANEHPYVLSVGNRSGVPLVVSFADLPEWLRFEIDDRWRDGPLPGRFFRRSAPFSVRIRPRPRFFGRRNGSIHLQTNDPRADMQSIELAFAACVEPAKPCVISFAPQANRLRADQSMTVSARLENWSRSPARVHAHVVPAALRVLEWPVVPAARDGQPGAAMLPIRILPAQLAPGAHALSVSIRVLDGEPAVVDVPMRVEVTPALPRRTGVSRSEMVAALLTLLLFALLFAVVVRGLS